MQAHLTPPLSKKLGAKNMQNLGRFSPQSDLRRRSD